MPVYYVQKFTYNNGDSLCYGIQDDHNHQVATRFTPDVTAWLAQQGCQNIRPGNFRSNQPEPANGKEFVWDNANGRWVKG